MVIFLYGEDSFRSHQKLLEIKEKYLASDKSGSGLSAFSADEKTKVQDIIDIFSLPNLLAPKRLVIIKRLLSGGTDTDQKKMAEHLKEAKNVWEDKDLVAVFWEDRLPKKNGVLFKLLAEKSKSQEHAPLTGMKLGQWILKRAEEIRPGASMSQKALEKLVMYAGGDTSSLDNELRKLVAYADGKMISEGDIDILVEGSIDNNIFGTIEALGRNDKKEALKLLHNHLASGDDPFYILSMYVYQFRNLVRIADYRERGVVSEYEISKMTKLHPFVVKKSLSQIRNFSFQKLKEIYKELAGIDINVKTGKVDIKLALDMFVAEL